MRARRSITLAFSIWYFVFPIGFAARARAQSPPPPATLAELQQRLTEHLTNPRFAAANWGVKVVSLDSGRTLFEQNAGKLFSPASNCKLFTMALALDQLGGDCRIKTSLYAATKPDGRGLLKGDLIIYGRGDPLILSPVPLSGKKLLATGRMRRALFWLA